MEMLSHWLHWCVFFSSVYLHMFYKMASLFKSSVTLTTLMWFFPSVCSQMFCKIIYICKCLVTLATLKWVLPSVHSLVLYKIKLFQINTCCHDHMKMVFSSVYSLMRYKTICSVNINLFFFCVKTLLHWLSLTTPSMGY